MQDLPEDYVLAGQISGLFGVKGWVKIRSWTEPRENILKYSPWLVKTTKGWTELKVEQGNRQGKGVVARLEGYDDRDLSAQLTGCDIAVSQQQLPELAEDEYYWNDLIGLRVINQDGVDFGTVKKLIETGSNDVLIVEGDRERLVPYIKGQVIKAINLEAKEIQVEWDPDF